MYLKVYVFLVGSVLYHIQDKQNEFVVIVVHIFWRLQSCFLWFLGHICVIEHGGP